MGKAAGVGYARTTAEVVPGPDTAGPRGPDLRQRFDALGLGWLQLGGLAVPAMILTWAAWERRWMSDDGFINLRVVDQLLAGHGPVFNAGERVEAATSPLWVAILALGDLATPVRLEWIAVTLGIVFSVCGLVSALVASLRLWTRAGGGVVVPVGATCLVAVSPVWDFSSSGLEGGLAFCWLGVTLLLFTRWSLAKGQGQAAAAVVAGVGPLVRPDFAVISLVLLIALLIGEHPWSVRRGLKLVGQFALIPAAYEVFRVAYYGAVVPNTYFAKEGGRSNWAAGWRYLDDFVGPYLLWVPLAVLGVAAIVPLVTALRERQETRAALVAASFPVGGALSALAIVRLGGDFMHGRLLLPSLFAILAPVAAIRVRRATASALLVVPWALVCLAALRPPAVTDIRRPADHRAVIQGLVGTVDPVTLEDFGYAPDGPSYFRFDEAHRLHVGRQPAEVDGRPVPLVPGAPDRVLLSYGVGAVGYFAGPDVYVLDMLGLGDTLTARLEFNGRGPLPGHEKALPPAWAWARYIDPGIEPDPDLIVPPGILTDISPTLQAASRDSFATQVAAARTVLECRDVADLIAWPRRQVDARSIIENAWQSLTNFRLRVPPHPTDAREELC